MNPAPPVTSTLKLPPPFVICLPPSTRHRSGSSDGLRGSIGNRTHHRFENFVDPRRLHHRRVLLFDALSTRLAQSLAEFNRTQQLAQLIYPLIFRCSKESVLAIINDLSVDT